MSGFKRHLESSTQFNACPPILVLFNATNESSDTINELRAKTNMVNLVSDETADSVASDVSRASVATTVGTTTIMIEEDPIKAKITSDDVSPDFIDINFDNFNIDRYRELLYQFKGATPSYSYSGGKRRNNRYKLSHKTTMKKRKIIKGGSIHDWVCEYKEFVAWVMMMSCLSGGYWCLAKFIIPIAIAELGEAVWRYIVKICETTAVIITNLFKTNGGLSKFIDLLVESYRGRAVTFKILDDVNIRIIKPFFDLIVSAITWGCAKTASSDASASAAPGAAAPGAAAPPANIEALTEDLRTQLHTALERIAKLERVAIQQIEQNAERNVAIPQIQEVADPIIPQIQEVAKPIIEVAEPIIHMIEQIIQPLAQENIHAIDKEMERDIKGGENIISYLAKKIKKTMKRRKRSHKKYAKKNIHYKSHKKNKR
jgi:hypothetical protein